MDFFYRILLLYKIVSLKNTWMNLISIENKLKEKEIYFNKYLAFIKVAKGEKDNYKYLEELNKKIFSLNKKKEKIQSKLINRLFQYNIFDYNNLIYNCYKYKIKVEKFIFIKDILKKYSEHEKK